MIAIFLVLFFSFGHTAPSCLESNPLASHPFSDVELLTRLVFAEGVSTNASSTPTCAPFEEEVLEAIAWGVRNRVELAKAFPKARKEFGEGLAGVIFKKNQFNPAISKRSPFSLHFRCPSKTPEFARLWSVATQAAGKALGPVSQSPFPKHQAHHRVSHFYYPLSIQAKGKPPQWAHPKSQARVAPFFPDGKKIPDSCIWFFDYFF